MKTKIILLLSTVLMTSSNTTVSSTFNYKYRIKGNSLSPIDSATAYYYKEEMIKKYEDVFFTLSIEGQKAFVNNNINFFKLHDNISVQNVLGTICITIGKGQGISIEGKFRKNECDEGVINEKYFFLELIK